MVAYATDSLDLLSAFVGAVLGYIIILTQGLNWFLVLLVFFITSTLVTKYKYSQKERYGVSQKRRRVENVLGNGLIPLAFALYGDIYGYLGALATANADTFSSEIGVLSKNEPVSVLDFKTKVKRGSNGGVSNLGNLFMFIGSSLIAFSAFFLFQSWLLFWLSLWAGVFGCMIDSFLGATLENKGMIGNSLVNLLATLSGGLLALFLSSI